MKTMKKYRLVVFLILLGLAVPAFGLARPVTISGDAGEDAKRYQEKAVKAAIAEASR